MSTLISQLSTPERYAAFLQMWARIQHELLYIIWGVMEVALFTPFLLSLMLWARYWPPGQVLLWLLMLMLFSFNLSRLLGTLQIAPDHQRSIIAVTMLFTLFFSIRGLVHQPKSLFDLSWILQFVSDVAKRGNFRWTQDLSIFAAVVFMWWRGIRLGNRDFSVSAIGLRLRLGGLILAPLIVWLASRWLVWDVSPFLLLFFLAALTAVSLIRAEQLEKHRSKQSATLDPRWLSIVFLAGLLIVLTASLLTVIITGESAGAIAGIFAPLIVSIQFLGSVALSTLLFISIPIFELIDIFILGVSGFLNRIWVWVLFQYAILQKILSKIVGANPSNPISDNPSSNVPDPEQVGTISINIGNLGEVSNIIVILLMVAIVLIITLTISGAYRSTKFARRKSHSIRRAGNKKVKDESLLDRLLKRLGFLQNWRAAASIRRVYRHMLSAADVSGYPRLESETPYEFLNTLKIAWPDHEADTLLITSAYVNVRYGEIPETEAELNDILAAWDRLAEAPPETAVTDTD